MDDLIWFFNYAAADAAGLRAAPLEGSGTGGVVDYYPERDAPHRSRVVMIQGAMERIGGSARVLSLRFTFRGRREALPRHGELTDVILSMTDMSFNDLWLACRKGEPVFDAIAARASLAVDTAVCAYRRAISAERAERAADRLRRDMMPGEG